MTSPSTPFEDPETEYLVLVNEKNQHSLWPAFADVPVGWAIAHGRASRRACVDYIDRNWTDLRPSTLLAAGEHDPSRY
ncbi:MbtH family protein [Rhodococcus xishaensis]|uniref:MbtH family protein n=1 Tax=Rhodococcus xishaensis TaxID=2487364 RepID=A0A438B058_9NOCA|nr:MbtH family protein [Rhodococcus xishaensis]RVW04361.1 MbtH family protein [Rhodococcus xishaensis]